MTLGLGWTIAIALVGFILLLIWIFWPRDEGMY